MDFFLLGIDVLKMIVKHLSMKDIVRLSAVNSKYRELLHYKSDLFKEAAERERHKSYTKQFYTICTIPISSPSNL